MHELLLRGHQQQQTIEPGLVAAATELQLMLRNGADDLQQVRKGPFSPRSRVALSPGIGRAIETQALTLTMAPLTSPTRSGSGRRTDAPSPSELSSTTYY